MSLLLPFLALVSVKTATDLVTNHVVRPPATAMALVAELSIFPLIVLWLAVGNGLKLLRRLGSSDDSASTPLRNIPAVFTDAAADRQGCLDLLGIGAVYALDGLVYFYAHSNVGAVTYTVLAQTKIFFTVAALRLRGMLSQLSLAQFAGLVSLFFGATLVSLKDVATGVAATSGNRAVGITCLLLGQACTSLANVAYEKRLRSPGADLWVRNVQLTASISLWLAVSSAVRAALILASGGVPPPPGDLLAAFCAPWVWLVVALKAATAVLIALTISAGGNVPRRARDGGHPWTTAARPSARLPPFEWPRPCPLHTLGRGRGRSRRHRARLRASSPRHVALVTAPPPRPNRCSTLSPSLGRWCWRRSSRASRWARCPASASSPGSPSPSRGSRSTTSAKVEPKSSASQGGTGLRRCGVRRWTYSVFGVHFPPRVCPLFICAQSSLCARISSRTRSLANTARV